MSRFHSARALLFSATITLFAGQAGAADQAPIAVDSARLLDDVRTLAAPEFAGRKTGTDGSRKAQAFLLSRFEALGLKHYGNSYVQPFSFTDNGKHGGKQAAKPTEYPNAANLVGYFPGTSASQRILLISAHYDHLGLRGDKMFPGADDNASGVAAMLAMAAHFKAHPPEHTVVFAAFDGEELGLRGARAFLAALPFPKQQLAMNLNLDMVSHNDQNLIFAAGTHHYPGLKPLVEQVAKRSSVTVKLGHDIAKKGAEADDWTDSSDHGPFHAAGIPFLYFGVEDHPDYHAPSDTFEHINQAFFVKVAALLVDMAATLDQQLDSVKPR